jgi:hypothetical protein
MTKKKIPEFLFYMKGCVQLRREMLFLSFAVKKKGFGNTSLKLPPLSMVKETCSD